MPKLVVGFSQKVGEPNYGSRGGNVVLELEVDGAAAANPEIVRAQLQGLFRLARQTVAEELSRPSAPMHANGLAPSTNGHGVTANNRIPLRPATPNQVKAIVGLAIRHHVNLSDLLPLRYRVNRAEELSITEASALIDELKSASMAPVES
jgi:hypothetical protein